MPPINRLMYPYVREVVEPAAEGAARVEQEHLDPTNNSHLPEDERMLISDEIEGDMCIYCMDQLLGGNHWPDPLPDPPDTALRRLVTNFIVENPEVWIDGADRADT